MLGNGSRTPLHPAHVQTDAYEVKRHSPTMVSGVILHSLPAGYRFDLNHRKLLPPLRAVASSQREMASLRAAGTRTQRLIRQIAAEGADDTSVERSRRRAQRSRAGQAAAEQ